MNRSIFFSLAILFTTVLSSVGLRAQVYHSSARDSALDKVTYENVEHAIVRIIAHLQANCVKSNQTEILKNACQLETLYQNLKQNLLKVSAPNSPIELTVQDAGASPLEVLHQVESLAWLRSAFVGQSASELAAAIILSKVGVVKALVAAKQFFNSTGDSVKELQTLDLPFVISEISETSKLAQHYRLLNLIDCGNGKTKDVPCEQSKLQAAQNTLAVLEADKTDLDQTSKIMKNLSVADVSSGNLAGYPHSARAILEYENSIHTLENNDLSAVKIREALDHGNHIVDFTSLEMQIRDLTLRSVGSKSRAHVATYLNVYRLGQAAGVSQRKLEILDYLNKAQPGRASDQASFKAGPAAEAAAREVKADFEIVILNIEGY